MRKTLIYNLFPTLAGPLDQWDDWVNHARDLGFNWVYINSPFRPGASGSLYAVADPYDLHPSLVPRGSAESGPTQLQRFLLHHRQRGMRFMTDLDLLHVAVDAPLVKRHPEWFLREPDGRYVHPFLPDPLDPDSMTLWDDRVQVVLNGAQAHEGIRKALLERLDVHVQWGFSGFRCMHAASVPPDLWHQCRKRAETRAKEPVLFVADALGVSTERLAELGSGGFDFQYNSSCWWRFDSGWAIEQHARLQKVAPTVSFPESHDTLRLAGDPVVQFGRYLFSAWFSSAMQMTMGYEYCWKNPLHAAKSTVEQQEPRTGGIAHLIRTCNHMIARDPLFCGEGTVRLAGSLDGPVVRLEKHVDGHSGELILSRKEPAKVWVSGEICRPFHPENGQWVWENMDGEVELAPHEGILIRRSMT